MRHISGSLVLWNIGDTIIAAAALIHYVVAGRWRRKCYRSRINCALYTNMRLNHARICNWRIQLCRTRKRHCYLGILISVAIKNCEILRVTERRTIRAKAIAVHHKLPVVVSSALESAVGISHGIRLAALIRDDKYLMIFKSSCSDCSYSSQVEGDSYTKLINGYYTDDSSISPHIRKLFSKK